MLYQNMLEAPSGGDQGHAALTGQADHCVGALGVR